MLSYSATVSPVERRHEGWIDDLTTEQATGNTREEGAYTVFASLICLACDDTDVAKHMKTDG
jgi:hypothetical protein